MGQGTAGTHIVMTGFSSKMGSLKLRLIRKSWVKAGIPEEVGASILSDLQRGNPRHIPLPQQRNPTEETIRVSRKFATKLGIRTELCSCDYSGLESLRRALSTDARTDALRKLIAAAQADPAACDILIDDALSRDDVLQADHWQTRKRQLQTPPTVEKPTGGSSGTSTWIGVSTPIDGGDF